MKKSRIYNLAYAELLRKLDYEKSFLTTGNKSGLASARVANIQKEIDELHEMILEAEKEERIV